jgi:hypothetical protein
VHRCSTPVEFLADLFAKRFADEADNLLLIVGEPNRVMTPRFPSQPVAVQRPALGQDQTYLE